MDLQKIITSTKQKKYLIITEAQLNELLANSKLLKEENTYISDKIRLLEYEDELILQEKTTKDEYLIRIIATLKEAHKVIKERLEIYDRMWDGCGCKVDYYK